MILRMLFQPFYRGSFGGDSFCRSCVLCINFHVSSIFICFLWSFLYVMIYIYIYIYIYICICIGFNLSTNKRQRRDNGQQCQPKCIFYSPYFPTRPSNTGGDGCTIGDPQWAWWNPWNLEGQIQRKTLDRWANLTNFHPSRVGLLIPKET